jgi:hypothetical protein
MEKVETRRGKIIEISSLAGTIISGLTLMVIASFYNDVKAIPVLVYRVQDQKELLQQHEVRLSEIERIVYAKTN